MPTFRRAFDGEKLAAWDQQHAGNAVHALFDRWALPGEAASGTRTLRVGIRDGYLNLYAKGQSVAKLSIGGAGPSISVHDAYVSGRRAGEPGGAGQTYVTFDAAALADPATAALVPGWIATAESHASAEKRFVDDLIAANAGVIDLEKGPARQRRAGQ